MDNIHQGLTIKYLYSIPLRFCYILAYFHLLSSIYNFSYSKDIAISIMLFILFDFLYFSVLSRAKTSYSLLKAVKDIVTKGNNRMFGFAWIATGLLSYYLIIILTKVFNNRVTPISLLQFITYFTISRILYVESSFPVEENKRNKFSLFKHCLITYDIKPMVKKLALFTILRFVSLLFEFSTKSIIVKEHLIIIFLYEHILVSLSKMSFHDLLKPQYKLGVNLIHKYEKFLLRLKADDLLSSDTVTQIYCFNTIKAYLKNVSLIGKDYNIDVINSIKELIKGMIDAYLYEYFEFLTFISSNSKAKLSIIDLYHFNITKSRKVLEVKIFNNLLLVKELLDILPLVIINSSRSMIAYNSLSPYDHFSVFISKYFTFTETIESLKATIVSCNQSKILVNLPAYEYIAKYASKAENRFIFDIVKSDITQSLDVKYKEKFVKFLGKGQSQLIN